MKAESQSLKRIFQGAVRFTVPLYQRPYVWRHDPDDPENDRLGPFWDDVKQTVDRVVEHERLLRQAGDPDKLAPMTPHFFGAVVIDEPEKISGGVVAHEVIDGQQRLTTAQILIAAAARTCDSTGRPRHASRLRRLWVQDDDVDVAGADRLKLRPTRNDRPAFVSVMDPLHDARPATDRVSAAYAYFLARLTDWVAELPAGREEEYVDALRDTVYEHLLFVVIELQPGDNPQGIFESLNAQGERLLAIDLVKNQVFRRARRSGIDLDRLDTEKWSARFGDEWWRTDVKQGRYRRPRAELFLMHWLTEQTEAEVSATGLYIEFVRLFGHDRVPLDAVERFVTDLVADAATYQQFDQLDSGSRERLFFARREVLDIGVVFPVALRLWRCRENGVIGSERLVDGLRALESWLVRRMTLRLTTQNYNRVMLDLVRHMGTTGDPVARMVEHLGSFDEGTPTGWWPTDAAFRNQLVREPLYNWVSQARVRLLLEAAEARLHTPKTESMSLAPRLTIEHVIPQKWPRSWPLDDPDDADAVDRRNNSLHRLGNLTLVTKSLNPALSNDPWASKRSELARHSALRLNAQLVHDHLDKFDENAIDERSEQLADLLIAEWPGPTSWLDPAAPATGRP